MRLGDVAGMFEYLYNFVAARAILCRKFHSTLGNKSYGYLERAADILDEVHGLDGDELEPLPSICVVSLSILKVFEARSRVIAVTRLRHDLGMWRLLTQHSGSIIPTTMSPQKFGSTSAADWRRCGGNKCRLFLEMTVLSSGE